MQEDMKKLIAYSSVAHMGYVTLGIFTLTKQGIEGSIFQMISHGLISAALFLCVGVVYDRLHSRMISSYGGLVNIMPKYAFVFMIFVIFWGILYGNRDTVSDYHILRIARNKISIQPVFSSINSQKSCFLLQIWSNQLCELIQFAHETTFHEQIEISDS